MLYNNNNKLLLLLLVVVVVVVIVVFISKNAFYSVLFCVVLYLCKKYIHLLINLNI